MPKKVEVSHRTIIFAALFIIFLWFLYFIRDLLMQLIVALLLTAILDPFVSKLSFIKIPRGVAVLLTYLLTLGSVGVVIALLAPPLVTQTTSFATSLPGYIARLGITPIVSAEIGKELLTRVGSIPEQIIKFSLSVFSNILSVLTVLVFAFYLILSSNKLDEQLSQFFGADKAKMIADAVSQIEAKIGTWVRGQLVLMTVVGVMNYIGLFFLGVPFAVPLAILAGIFEVVPYLGPILAAVPAILIGFGISNFTGFGVLIMAIVVQQIENYILVPKIMGRSVGISPVIILMALAIGQRLAGVVGMLISVPLVITLQVILKDYLFKK